MESETATTAGDVEDSIAIDKCSACGSRIALRPPSPSSPALPSLCTGCGSVYFARSQDKNGKPYTRGTRPVDYKEVMRAINVFIEGKASPISRKDVQRLLQCLSTRTFTGKEARSQKRSPIAAPVIAIPLSPDFRVSGQPSRMTTLNISGGGLALIHTKHFVEPYLAVDFAPSGVDLLPAILQITRVRSLGSAYEVAGKFQSRILQTP